MRIQKILLGVTGGWFVLSLGVVAYLMLTAAEPSASAATGAMPQPRMPPQANAASPAHPPDFAPEMPADAERDPELGRMLYRYFPRPVSQHMEEVFIRDYFEDRKGGVFLDVGASHYKIRSNTYYLDIALGWHGIAVDAIAELGPDYVKHRPRTKFFGMFVSDKSDQDVDFFVVLQNSRLSTGDAKSAEVSGQHETRKMKTATLNALLESQGVKKVDMVNMDIELWEPQALAGFDIDKYKPDLVVIEMHPPVAQQINDYFAQHGYVVIDKYTKWDGTNAYFVPKADLAKFLAREPPAGVAAQPAAAPSGAAPAANAPAEHKHETE